MPSLHPKAIPRSKRVLLVLGGYVVAFVSACIATYVYSRMTESPDANTASGMYAFGDLLFFVGFLAAGSVPPTVLLIYFWRSTPPNRPSK